MIKAGVTLAILAVACSVEANQRWRDEPLVGRGLIAGWTGLVDPAGGCRFSVPAPWRDVDRLVFAPDGTATVEEEHVSSETWTQYRTGLSRTLKPTVLHENSTTRIWFEYDPGWQGAHHHVAVPTPDGACVLRIDIRSSAAETLKGVIRQIAESLIALP